MSKDQKPTITLNVETVDNLRKQIEYLNTTMEFWKLHEKWPRNLINDVLKELTNEIIDIIDFNSQVSSSHIIDKQEYGQLSSLYHDGPRVTHMLHTRCATIFNSLGRKKKAARRVKLCTTRAQPMDNSRAVGLIFGFRRFSRCSGFFFRLFRSSLYVLAGRFRLLVLLDKFITSSNFFLNIFKIIFGCDIKVRI